MTSRFIKHTDILSSEVYEDGISITQSKRLSQLGGIAVGGLLMGGVGAVIGGLSGRKKTADSVNNITIRLCINDIQSPIIDIQILHTEVTKNHPSYISASEQARQWQTIFSILIKRADSESQPNPTIESKTNLSVADEIKKLSDLKESGAITEDEYKTLKLKLLSN